MYLKKKKTWATAVLTLLMMVVASCTKNELYLGAGFIPSYTSTQMDNSMPIELSTFKLDSVVTSSQNRIWVGSVNMPVIGDIHSESYFRLDEPVVKGVRTYSWLNKKEVYDSVCIVLRHTGEYEGDTTKSVTLDVRMLGERLERTKREEAAGAFFNKRTFRDSVSIGSFSFLPMPHIRPRVRYRLNDEFGHDLTSFIQKMARHDNDAKLQKQYFDIFMPGIKICSKEGSDPKSMIAFRADSVMIVLHSHILGLTEKKIERQFKLTELNYQFNHVWNENVDPGFDKLVNKKVQIKEAASGLHSVLYEGLGYYTRVNIPKPVLESWSQYYGHVVKATLKIYLEKGCYDRREISKFISLYPYAINRYNVVGDPLYNAAGQQVRVQLNFNSQSLEESYYTIDLTYFINMLLQQQEDIEEGMGIVLMWQAGMRPTNYNFMLFNGHGVERHKTELEVYYYDYDREY